MPETSFDPIGLLRPRRRITGMAAMLLPFSDDGSIDWRGFETLLEQTVGAGLIPAVNMDTGYVHLLDDAARLQVLERARQVMAGKPFVAGAFVADRPGSPFDRDAYLRQIEPIVARGGTPVIFQSFGLTGQADDDIVASYEELGRHCDRFIGFELGSMFAPFGRIYSLDVYRGLVGIKKCIGAKHSSLRRDLEWQRLVLRDALRPDFQVFTGNDLAIDMVIYGSDYLLGLATFAPEQFARRDRLWESGDPGFYQLNDLLQYLGQFAFRPPVPAYKHSAAQFLKLRGWIGCDATHPDSPHRSQSDLEVLRDLAERLETLDAQRRLFANRDHKDDA
jgi:dihydrodipicolinate synthase/N-acetylneuraminate lyase